MLDNINIYLDGHDYLFEVQNVIQIFYPNNKYTRIFDIRTDKPFFYSAIKDNKCVARFYDDKIYEQTMLVQISYKHTIKKCLYKLLETITGYKNPWGHLTGIRPSKKIGELVNQNFDEHKIITYMQDNYYTDKSKSKLALDVYKNQINILKNNNGDDTSLYIGIPFCPTTCKYCSFTSYPIAKHKHIISDYINALEKEMIFASNYLKNRYLETIYIGGGTPTSLDDNNLERLFELINKYFDVKSVKEYTVEAGRPDTITKSKLKILKQNNVSRISINPQTLNDETLIKIGRNHTTDEFFNSFNLAREQFFDNINIDIILGLPDENLGHLNNTLEGIHKLKSENLTVHTLSIKKGSKLKEDLHNSKLGYDAINQMILETQNFAKGLNMHPYYMYRQKNMIGNFENVGYSKQNYFCIYNVQIMEDKQNIIALGAGASTKIVYLEQNRLERIFNVKSLDDYINRIDEMILRKENIYEHKSTERN